MYEDIDEQIESKGNNAISLYDKYALKFASLFGEIEGSD
jgi:hypothetical protein